MITLVIIYLSSLRYLGNMGRNLPYCEEKLKGQGNVGTIPANFPLGSFSNFHSLKRKSLGFFFSAGEQLQGLPPRTPSSESCQEVKELLQWSFGYQQSVS